MNRFWNFFLSHGPFTVLLMVIVVVIGLASIVQIPKESAPEVNVPFAMVVTSLPGASAAEVEPLVTNVLERPLRGNLDHVNAITSVSSESVSTITVEFNADADLDTALADLRSEVDAARSELPDEATDPQVVELDFAAQPVLTVSLGANVPTQLLYELGHAVEDELENIPGVSSVSVGGVGARQITVLIDRGALERHGLSVSAVAGAISSANTSLPAGSIRIGTVEYPVRVSESLENAAEVERVPIVSAQGAPIYVGDVATVLDSYISPETLARTSVEGNPSQASISLSVFKASGSNVTSVSADVRERLEELQQPGELLESAQVHLSIDSGELLQRDLSTLAFTGIQTTLLVMLVLALAIGWREALIAGSAIPLSLLAAFGFMYYTDNTLNFISLFSLVLVIGIIVDAAIVMVEGINTRVRGLQGEPGGDLPAQTGKQAAGSAIAQFGIPLISGTMTTVAVFAPLFLISGIVGEFIQSIPFTVIAVLLSSIFVSLGFVPLIAARFAGKSIGGFGGRRRRLIEGLEQRYRAYLRELFANRKNASGLLTAMVFMLVLVFTLPAIGALPVVFFESEDTEYLYAEIEMPQGTELAATDIMARTVEELLYDVPEIESFVTTIGRSSEYNPEGSETDERLANMFITLAEDRHRTSVEVVDELHDRFQAIETADVSINQLSDGPPTGSPIAVTLSGDNLADLDRAAAIVAQTLTEIPGTSDISTSADDSALEFVITMNRAQALTYGATAADAAGSLRAAVYGLTASKLRGTDQDVDIITKLDFGSTNPTASTVETDPDTLLLTPISASRAPGSSPVLLGSFADIEPAQNRASIRHEDGKRTVTVTGNVAEGGNAFVISRQLSERMQPGDLPDGVSMQIGGENEDINQSFTEMFLALILGIIGIFAILVLQFNSFRYATYVLMTVPLSLIGVFAGLLLVDRPISFPSIMGFIALAGVVVNNAIILIDTINSERRARPHDDLAEVVADASTSRLRPVLLTTLTTVIGIMPLLFTADIWIPLAIAIMFGLAFATILTLVLVPVTYQRWPGKRFA